MHDIALFGCIVSKDFICDTINLKGFVNGSAFHARGEKFNAYVFITYNAMSLSKVGIVND